VLPLAAVDTPIINGQFKEQGRGGSGITPLGRIGRPEEMASAILFLVSGASSNWNGFDLVEGGGIQV
jgi:NAD(P)-dependent dehydrogenase (short-subunit alcohol dehydrogenase family)